jgi:CPA2 family monovalent cation:H+ antiporter-2
MHEFTLISTVAAGFGLALVLGYAANRIGAPPLVGYLVAGIVIGPATPGFVADMALTSQLAEIGVMLMMFGVGLHFSIPDLMAVQRIAIPGAVAQIAAATGLAALVAHLWGWHWGPSLVFGLALSVASTVVLLRLLQERRLLETERGKITVGWLIVQDIAMILVLVMIPGLTGLYKGLEAAPDGAAIAREVGLMLGKFAIFIAVMLVVGKKLIPGLLHYVAHTGSRELFRLAVLSIALGVAYAAAELFGVSLALGAFFAGMMLSESRLSQQAAQESLPLRDAFAVLFFVSVGMLFNPSAVFAAPLALLATVLIILIGKSIAAYAVVRLFGLPGPTALTVSTSLAQIGEFSFILAGLGLSLGLLPAEGRDLILAGAIITIILNPLLFAALDVLLTRREKAVADRPSVAMPEAEATPTRELVRPTTLTNHIVLIGHGRVGSFISGVLGETKTPMFVIEDDKELVAELKEQGIEGIAGNAADPALIAAANLGAARCLLVAIPDAFEGGQVVQQARAINPALPIIARAHSEDEIEHLKKHGADLVVMGEHEIAKAMIETVGALRTHAPESAPAEPSPPVPTDRATEKVAAGNGE